MINIASTSKSTTTGLIIYRHSTRANLRHFAREKTEGKLPKHKEIQGNLWLNFLPHSLD